MGSCGCLHCHWCTGGGGGLRSRAAPSTTYTGAVRGAGTKGCSGAVLTEIHQKGSIPAFAVVSLGGYTPGLRPRPNTPGTHWVWKTHAPPRLVHPRSLTETRVRIRCISHHTCCQQIGSAGYASGIGERARHAAAGTKTPRTAVFVWLGCYSYEAALQKLLS